MKSDLREYVAARKRREPEFADGYDAGYEEFKLGLLLRQAREEAGLTQAALATRARTPRATIARSEANPA
jgi:ribosome-binding protein aMBF1 (putative translation factor)